MFYQAKSGLYDISIKFAEQHVPGRVVICFFFLFI
jgi:hypothetical protein